MSHSDEKLKWCRENAPASLREVDDTTLLKLMGNAYEKMLKLDIVSNDSDKGETAVEKQNKYCEKNPENEMFDYMVYTIASEFGNNVAFKGGYMLTKLIPHNARQTVDIDFSILRGDMYEHVKKVLQSIAEHFIENGLITSYEIKDTIAPIVSGGMKMQCVNGKSVGVDVGWHDITWGTTIVKLDIGEVNSFTVERMLSDKIVASCTKKRFRRVKDVYDIYAISNCLEFDASIVALNILSRTGGVGVEWEHLPFTDVVLRELSKAYDRLVIKSIYVDGKIDKPSFKAVMDRYSVITEKVQYLLGDTYWNPSNKMFE